VLLLRVIWYLLLLLQCTSLAAGNMSILMSALEAANISSAITNETAWTILAPNNAAFEKTLAALNLTAQELLANQVRLSACSLCLIVSYYGT
jgi:uncharacterized surface protein with fasciclin (FAS1) repeats